MKGNVCVKTTAKGSFVNPVFQDFSLWCLALPALGLWFSSKGVTLCNTKVVFNFSSVPFLLVRDRTRNELPPLLPVLGHSCSCGPWYQSHLSAFSYHCYPPCFPWPFHACRQSVLKVVHLWQVKKIMSCGTLKHRDLTRLFSSSDHARADVIYQSHLACRWKPLRHTTQYSEIPMSWTLDFLNLPITWSKSSFPSLSLTL